MSPTIKELIENGDVFSLLRILRRHPNREIRIEVAGQLVEIHSPDCVEALIRAALADDAPEVRSAARAALIQRLGKTEADLAVSAYGSVDGVMPYEKATSPTQRFPPTEQGEVSEDDWEYGQAELEAEEIVNVEVPAEFLDFASEDHSSHWDEEHLNSLILILREDGYPERQLKALRVLADHLSPSVIDALSAAALWSETPLVKSAAFRALERQYGQDTQHLLAEFQSAQAGLDPDQDDYDDEHEDEGHWNDLSPANPARIPSPQSRPVEPEGLSGRGILFALLLILGAGAFLVYWLLLR